MDAVGREKERSGVRLHATLHRSGTAENHPERTDW